MLDKFRDLSTASKITILFTALFAAIGLIFAIGLGIKALTPAQTNNEGNGNTASPTESPSASPTQEPDYTDSQDQIDSSNPDTVGSDKDDISLQEGYIKAEKFVTTYCNFDTRTKTYKEYYNDVKAYFASDTPLNILDESVYNEIKIRTCEINVGQPQGQVGENRYLNVMGVSTKTTYNSVNKETNDGYPFNVIMGIEKGKWVVYGVSFG